MTLMATKKYCLSPTAITPITLDCNYDIHEFRIDMANDHHQFLGRLVMKRCAPRYGLRPLKASCDVFC